MWIGRTVISPAYVAISIQIYYFTKHLLSRCLKDSIFY